MRVLEIAVDVELFTLARDLVRAKQVWIGQLVDGISTTLTNCVNMWGASTTPRKATHRVCVEPKSAPRQTLSKFVTSTNCSPIRF